MNSEGKKSKKRASQDSSAETKKILLESKEPFRGFIESVRAGLYMTDPQGKLFFVNQLFVKILGFSGKKQLLDKKLMTVLKLDPKGRETFQNRLKAKGFIRDFEIKRIRKGENPIVLSVTGNLIKDKSEKILGMVGLVQDITERKTAEEEKKKLHEQLEIEKRKLEQVLSIEQKISSILDLNHLVDFVIEKTTEILEADKCSLMLLDADSQELLIRGAKGLDGEIIKAARIKIGDQIAGLVARDGEPILVDNIEQYAALTRKNRPAYRGKSFLSVPIKVHNTLVGVVNVADKKPGNSGYRRFTPIDLKILCTIVRQAAIAIENANYYRKVEHLSVIDSLTGVYNYRYFLKSLDQEMTRFKRYPRPLCLLRLDIDNFKAYNDVYGQVEGDEILRCIGKALKEKSRDIDIICRYAGDEFVAILPETDTEQAQIVAKKLKNAINLIASRARIAVSIGIALCGKTMDRRDLILRADQALYQAKHNGVGEIICLE